MADLPTRVPALALLLLVAQATGQSHWAFKSPQPPSLPAVKDGGWVRTPVDRFILARLDAEGLEPSPVAGKAILIRRLYLDLTGLPPTPARIDAFLADDSPDACERLVDRLLDSPRYGERMALDWLDVSRYGDTDGYEVDEARSMWPWRDWVIRALNANMPFDQFTIEQLAGDMIADATLKQKIATGFNRNHRINREAGTIAEEWRVDSVVDRVDTTATVWLALTMACARCHDHKYDPISQEEFYRFFAFFNNVPDIGNYGGGQKAADPVIRLTTTQIEVTLDELEEKIAAAGEDKELLKELQKQKEKLLAPFPVVMVMKEQAELRKTFVLDRGQYDRPGQPVSAGVPAALGPLSDAAVADRLALARWLVDGSHPLTARVLVNRIWQMHFGRGLVKTTEDFGTRGSPPSHPQLLDWLATELVRSGWDLKVIHKLILCSATYRQSSKLTPSLRRHDPLNILLARTPRLRLTAETIRDQALAISGLLVERTGGPPVKPYQPPNLWKPITSNLAYVQDHGQKLYRRSMYTFWKRTIPPPAMLSFDAPSREICTVGRSKSNTPLQALVLLNDTTFVEAARALAQRMIREGGETVGKRIGYGFRLATARRPTGAELTILVGGFEDHFDAYRIDQEQAAAKLLKVGESSADPDLQMDEVAAYLAVASVILNLDETITRQ